MPGLNCYSCPAASGACPIGAFQAVVGSSNFDKMSLYINKEMSLGISDPAFVHELETRLFETDFENSEELTEPLELAWTASIVTALTNQM